MPTTTTKTRQFRRTKMWWYQYLRPHQEPRKLHWHSKWSKARYLNTSVKKARITSQLLYSSEKIKDLARTNCWNDATTYANVANNLKGFARDWLFATAEMLDWTPAQLTWTNLKPRFQPQFATQTDEKMIMEGLSNLAMKPGESTGELLARITNTMVIIKDSYASY